MMCIKFPTRMEAVPFPTYMCKHSPKSIQRDSLFFNSNKLVVYFELKRGLYPFPSQTNLTVFYSFSNHRPMVCYIKAYGLLYNSNGLTVIRTWVVALPHSTLYPKKKSKKMLPNWGPYFSSMLNLKVSLKETTIWVGIFKNPNLRRL